MSILQNYGKRLKRVFSMQFSYYLHGTPYGFKYVGNPDEENLFFKRYYNGKRDIDEFRIETRQVNGKSYVYYTYILGANVYDGQNMRPGAYMGITIRLDQYYVRARNFYLLIDSFFHSYWEYILPQNGSDRYFKVTSFESLVKDLEKLEALIMNCFSPNDLKPLQSIVYNATPIDINVGEADDTIVYNSILQNGNVSLSFLHKVSAISNIQQQIDSKVNEAVATVKLDYQNELNRLQSALTADRKKLTEMSKELASASKNKEKIDSISRLLGVNPIQNHNNVSALVEPSTSERLPGKKRKWYLLKVLVTFVVGWIIMLFGLLSVDFHLSHKIGTLTEKVDSTSHKVDSISHKNVSVESGKIINLSWKVTGGDGGKYLKNTNLHFSVKEGEKPLSGKFSVYNDNNEELQGIINNVGTATFTEAGIYTIVFSNEEIKKSEYEIHIDE
jgi:hypothetical protein